MNNSISILSTVQLEQPLINKAVLEGVQLDIMPFIQVVDITDDSDLQKKIGKLYQQKATVIFTSTNAVYAVCETPAFRKPDWDVYCIKNATEKAVLEYFDAEQIKGTSNDAAKLAAEILKADSVKDAVFFCGDKRMNTLPDALNNGGINVNEIIVYGTVETPVFVPKEYDGILFFSPTAVNSFFSMNMIDPATTLFAIGNTTAQTLREQAENKVLVSEVATKEHVLDTAIAYLKKGTTTKQL